MAFEFKKGYRAHDLDFQDMRYKLKNFV